MRKGTKKNLLVAATYGAVLFLGLLLGQNFTDENSSTGRNTFLPLSIIDNSGKVQRLIDLVADNYVDSIGTDDLQDLAIDEIVAQLDPHSEYLRPNQAFRQHETLEGSFEGRSEEHTSELQSLMRISYAVFCLKKNKKQKRI